MQKLNILNSKEKKQILIRIKEQWGCDFKTDLVFMMNQKEKIYLIDRTFENIELKNLKIDSMGSYFGKLERGDLLRLSIEGSQLIGPIAKKNVVELSEFETRAMLKGKDIEKEVDGSGFLILSSKHKSCDTPDYMGCAKYKEGILLNFIPKTRRILGGMLKEED